MTIAILGMHRQVDVFDYDATLKPVLSVCGMTSFALQRFPSDPVGTFSLTLTNVVVGSRIHIETQGDGTTLHDSVADTTDETIGLPVYVPGSAYNALRIKVRKGSGAPTYKPFETLATAIVGAQSIYIGQIADE